MSLPSKPLTLSGINDALFGVFSHLNNSDKLDHLLRYLGTWSGSDKLLMLIQYTAKLVIPFLELRARLQYRNKLKPTPTTQASQGLSKLASLVGDARTLGRIWGILPIVQWLIALEKSPPPTRTLLTIERLQGLSMLVYYPLEHISYLLSHAIIPTVFTLPSILSLLSGYNPNTPRKLRLDAGKLGIWSVRAWAVYVLLQLLHLREDAALLRRRSRTLAKAKGKAGDVEAEKRDIRSQWHAWMNELVVNLAYLPLTVHWSLEQGIFKNDAWVSFLGFIAAAASFRSGWKATAMPPSAAPTISALSEKEGIIPERGFEDALAMPSLLIQTTDTDPAQFVGYNASA